MQEGIQLPELLARIKVLREAGLRAMTPSSWRTPPTTMTTTTMRRCRTAFSCGRGLAVQAYLSCLLCKTPG
jgi:hypothetical protein